LTQSAITFDEIGFERKGVQAGAIIWLTPDGDMLGLFHYPLKPDIKAELHDAEGLRRFYREMAREAGIGVIEIERVIADDCPAVRTLFKAAQQPSGRIYVGALTIPFQDFSYVLKLQCQEQGATGVRDTMVLMQLMATGESELDEKTGAMSGWLDDPYDAQESGTMTRNKSERREYDTQFPDHPLSRARRVLDHLEQTVKIAGDVKMMPAFSWQG
jgi:hypothetical protein